VFLKKILKYIITHSKKKAFEKKWKKKENLLIFFLKKNFFKFQLSHLQYIWNLFMKTFLFLADKKNILFLKNMCSKYLSKEMIHNYNPSTYFEGEMIHNYNPSTYFERERERNEKLFLVIFILFILKTCFTNNFLNMI